MPFCTNNTGLGFHPRFESLSDEDLDICEIIALAVIMGVNVLDWNVLKQIFPFTSCFDQMPDRQKREWEIWWVLYLANSAPGILPDCVTDLQMRRLIDTIRTKTTLEQRKGALTGLRTATWNYAGCSDL